MTRPEGGADVGIGLSVVVLALGAALVWGTTVHVRSVALTVAGGVLLVLGAAGSVISLAYRRRCADHRRRARDDRLIVDC